MALVIFFTLDRKNGRNVIFLKYLDVTQAFWIATDKDVRSHLGNFKSVETAIVMDCDISLEMSDFSSLGMNHVLILKLEDSSWLSFALNGISLYDVVVFELLNEPECVK
jgi:hypothetical protein